MSLLELQSVGARYGPVKVLHEVSLTVGEGELVAVLGPPDVACAQRPARGPLPNTLWASTGSYPP